ncbi:hypothetical protein FKM82_005722 [Ascaphus truei]
MDGERGRVLRQCLEEPQSKSDNMADSKSKAAPVKLVRTNRVRDDAVSSTIPNDLDLQRKRKLNGEMGKDESKCRDHTTPRDTHSPHRQAENGLAGEHSPSKGDTTINCTEKLGQENVVTSAPACFLEPIQNCLNKISEAQDYKFADCKRELPPVTVRFDENCNKIAGGSEEHEKRQCTKTNPEGPETEGPNIKNESEERSIDQGLVLEQQCKERQGECVDKSTDETSLVDLRSTEKTGKADKVILMVVSSMGQGDVKQADGGKTLEPKKAEDCSVGKERGKESSHAKKVDDKHPEKKAKDKQELVGEPERKRAKEHIDETKKKGISERRDEEKKNDPKGVGDKIVEKTGDLKTKGKENKESKSEQKKMLENGSTTEVTEDTGKVQDPMKKKDGGDVKPKDKGPGVVTLDDKSKSKEQARKGKTQEKGGVKVEKDHRKEIRASESEHKGSGGKGSNKDRTHDTGKTLHTTEKMERHKKPVDERKEKGSDTKTTDGKAKEKTSEEKLKEKGGLKKKAEDKEKREKDIKNKEKDVKTEKRKEHAKDKSQSKGVKREQEHKVKKESDPASKKSKKDPEKSEGKDQVKAKRDTVIRKEESKERVQPGNQGGRSRKRKSEETGDTKAKKTKEAKQKEEDSKWKWWEEDNYQDGVKWKFLEHKGPYFAPPYEPLPGDVNFLYDGKPMKLRQGTEEVATFYGKMLDHEYTTKEAFQKNFFTDWQEQMADEERKVIKHLRKCDFSEIHKYFFDKNETRKALPKEEKQKLKEESSKIQEEYGFCMLDGHREKIGNFKTEPPGLFRGRGDHPKMGMLKTRIMPEDVIINCSKESKVPDPPPGHRWKEVRSDNTVTWLASWTENIQGSIKYIMLNPSSKLKGEKDWQKYEIARRLKGVVDRIRSQYRVDWKSREMKKRQRAVALYFIDKLALRAGNEKEEGESADTVGCCSLRVEHIKLHSQLDGQQHVVEFDFLGKDSIRYYNKVEVEKEVFKNLKLFMENKGPEDDLFDRLNTHTVNKHLQELMDGLTAKVFRTYNASITLQLQLQALTNAEDNVAAKILSYNRANRAVALLCNHQRALPKTYEKSMQNLQAKIDAKKEQLRDAKSELKKAKCDHKVRQDEKSRKEVEKKQKQCERLEDQLMKLKLQATDKEENKQIALGTSKLNYLDPRITVAWCKKYGVPIEKIYNKTQRDKFAWAIDMTDEDFEF